MKTLFWYREELLGSLETTWREVRGLFSNIALEACLSQLLRPCSRAPPGKARCLFAASQ